MFSLYYSLFLDFLIDLKVEVRLALDRVKSITVMSALTDTERLNLFFPSEESVLASVQVKKTNHAQSVN